MKIINFISTVIFLSFSCALDAQEQDSIDNFYSETKKIIDVHNREIDALTERLMGIVLDTTLDKEKRRSAAFLIGSINSEKSIRFLFQNFQINLAVDEYLNDDDFTKEMLSYYALYRFGDMDAIMPVLLKELNNEVPFNDLAWYFSILRDRYGYVKAKDILRFYQKNAAGTYLKNLTILINMK